MTQLQSLVGAHPFDDKRRAVIRVYDFGTREHTQPARRSLLLKSYLARNTRVVATFA